MTKNSLLSIGNITLITGDRAFISHRTQQLIVSIALNTPVKLLIEGNRYDHYAINYAIASASSDYEHIMRQNIFLSRAETCYQMLELLIQTRADQKPTIILDLLASFYDEGVSDREINQLMVESIMQIRRLSQKAPVMISARPDKKRPSLFNVLKNLAHHVEYPPVPKPNPVTQYRLIE